jgi:hypothetical protein
MKSSLQSLIPCCHFILQTAKSGTQHNSEILVIWTRGEPHRKYRFTYCCVLIHCCRGVFTAPFCSNTRGTDYRKHCFSIVGCFRFGGNVFTGPLPSNELFRLSGIMSQYTSYSGGCEFSFDEILPAHVGSN